MSSEYIKLVYTWAYSNSPKEVISIQEKEKKELIEATGAMDDSKDSICSKIELPRWSEDYRSLWILNRNHGL
jgi:hypothetical protein